eukprot:SAG31_NODE_19911_length_588_cov_1.503067_1_plen_61_part_00
MYSCNTDSCVRRYTVTVDMELVRLSIDTAEVQFQIGLEFAAVGPTDMEYDSSTEDIEDYE